MRADLRHLSAESSATPRHTACPARRIQPPGSPVARRVATERAMPLDLDVPITKISPATQRIVDSAVVDAHRRGHTEVTTAHLFAALARAHWTLFSQVLREYGADGHAVMRVVDEELRTERRGRSGALHISPAGRLVCRLAMHRASR